MKVTRNRNKKLLTLQQDAFIDEISAQFQVQDCKPCPTPATAGLILTNDMSAKNEIDKSEMKNRPDRNLVGSTMYAMTGTRPDIAFAVKNVSRFLENPGEQHWVAAKRIIRYLAHTKDHGITYNGNLPVSLSGYVDADFASDIDTRKSTTGYILYVCGGPVSWNSKTQSIVTLSSTEAEYVASCMAAREVMFLKQVMKELMIRSFLNR